MDEVLECPKCKNQSWIIGTSGTRCYKCNYLIPGGPKCPHCQREFDYPIPEKENGQTKYFCPHCGGEL